MENKPKKEGLITKLGKKVDSFGERHPKMVRFTRVLGETALTFGKFTAKVLAGALIVVTAASRFVDANNHQIEKAEDDIGLLEANDSTNTNDI